MADEHGGSDKEMLIDNLAVDGLIIPLIHSLRQIINRQYDNILLAETKDTSNNSIEAPSFLRNQYFTQYAFRNVKYTQYISSFYNNVYCI